MREKLRRILLCVFISIILIGVIVAVILFNKNKMTAETSAEEVIEDVAEIEKDEIPVEWHGKYIWNDETENDTWTYFRKKLNIENENFGNVVAQIAVDSKYWLYINGEMVIREGAEKRGQTENSIYYDEIDLTQYLKKGENTIAILAWYWGDTSYSYNPSGKPGMLFQAKVGDGYIISDETWKVSHALGFENDYNIPNYRLAEYNIYYDANKTEENWYKPEFDDKNWQTPLIVGNAGDAPWGEMIKRDIPQFKNWDLKEYDNMSKYENYTTASDEVIEMTLKYNAQLTPYLKIETTSGKKITIKTDQYEDINGDSLMCTYITKDGVQEFESPGWINGEKVYYQIPAGVKVIKLAYRETGYDTEMNGNFESNDEFFNKLWKMASRTLYVNMRDTYMDCPNRERAQWWGDVTIDMMEAMYALDTKSYSLYEKGLKTLKGWSKDGVLQTVTPISAETMFLPIQMLSGVNSIYEYYLYSGNKQSLEEIYPYIKEFVDLWVYNETDKKYNLKPLYAPIWEWGDSAGSIDYDLEENMWYYYALCSMSKMASVLNKEEDAKMYNDKKEQLSVILNELWTENGYKSANCDFIDERVNAVAVISGLADETKYEVITNMFETDYQTSSCMEKYVLEALCEMGKIEEAQKRIKDRYNEMVNSEKACSTLWENWDYSISSKNHAWSGGPLIIMSKYFAGIQPLEKGYDKILIKPQFGELSKIFSNTTTVKGDISLEAEKLEEALKLKVKIPSKACIAVEKMSEDVEILINDKKIYKKGKMKNNKYAGYSKEDDKYIYLEFEKGEYEIVSK